LIVMNSKGYDPIERAGKVKELVTRVISGEELRAYFRFRGGRWYGGIATGDVIGCNLSCVFCWSWYFKDKPSLGKFLTPYEAFTRIAKIAERRGYRFVRLSGGEPTVSRVHLIKLARLFESTRYVFILETNGLLIGYDYSYAKELANISNLVVRVSFKGTTPDEFHRLTGAAPKFYELQFKALENLVYAGFEPGKEVYPAAMIGFSPDENIVEFVKRLKAISDEFVDVDWEYVFLYPHVERALKKAGLKPLRAVKPNKIPKSMI